MSTRSRILDILTREVKSIYLINILAGIFNDIEIPLSSTGYLSIASTVVYENNRNEKCIKTSITDSTRRHVFYEEVFHPKDLGIEDDFEFVEESREVLI